MYHTLEDLQRIMDQHYDTFSYFLKLGSWNAPVLINYSCSEITTARYSTRRTILELLRVSIHFFENYF